MIRAKKIALSVSGIISVLSTCFSFVFAQPVRNPEARVEPDTTLDIRLLLKPGFQHFTISPEAVTVSNPFPPRKKVPVPFLFHLGSAILKSNADEPFNSPNYGLATPPPVTFIEPENVTDYQLFLQRLNRHTTISQ